MTPSGRSVPFHFSDVSVKVLIILPLTFSSPFYSLSLSVGSVWVNSHSVSDPCLPVSGHKDSGTGTDGGQEVGLSQTPVAALTPALNSG